VQRCIVGHANALDAIWIGEHGFALSDIARPLGRVISAKTGEELIRSAVGHTIFWHACHDHVGAPAIGTIVSL
jgi:hypothetical protein